MRVSNSSPVDIAGAEHLTRINETWIDFTTDRPGAPQYANQQSDGRARPQFGQFNESLQIGPSVVGGAPALPFIDGSATAGYARWAARILSVNPDTYTGFHLGYLNRPLKVPFWFDNALRLPGVVRDDTVRAFVWEALLRKYNNVDAVNAQTGMFAYHGGSGSISPSVPSFSDPRVGLVGDGADGFRFGSVGCPDGSVATAENQIDANSVQPSGLVNPGLNWFLVKFKYIPAQLGGLPARVACYLDDVLVATFTAIANLPRGRATAATYDFMSLYPFIGMMQPAAVPQRNGLFVAFVHHWADEDLSV